MRRLLGLALLLLGTSVVPAAAEITVSASLDRAAAQVGDQVILTVEVEGSVRSAPEPRMPELGDDFDVYSGGTSRNFSILNGAVSSSYAVRFVVVPRKEGTFTIPAVTVEHEGQTLRSEPLTLTVTRGAPPPTVPPADPGEQGASTGGNDIFVRASVDKATATLYEQVTYRVRLYAALPLLDNPGFTAPTTEGFLREDLPRRDPYLEVIDGRRYRVLEVGIALFPTAPGVLTIGEAVLDCQVQAGRRRRPGSIFSGSLFDGKRLVLRSEPLEVTVRPLPPGPPAGFDGAVGEISLNAVVDRSTVSQNEPVTLTVTVRGRGHPRTFGEPELPALDGFRVYPSRNEESPDWQRSQFGGTVVREMVLVPLRAGETTIDPIELTAYSPRSRRYITHATKAIPLRVLASSSGGPVDGGGGRTGIEVIGTDIRFIDTDAPRFLSVTGLWPRLRGWILLLPLPLIGFVGAYLWGTRRERLGSDLRLQRRLRAARTAQSVLREAASASPEEQAARAGGALRGYVADRFDLPAAGLTPEDVRRVLGEIGLDPEPLVEFLERTDAARFAPGTGTGGASWLDEARGLLDRQESAS